MPEPSERCTTVIGRFGRFTPWFMAAMRGSFHLVISPRKIWAISWPVRRSWPDWMPGTFRAGTIPPMTIGN